MTFIVTSAVIGGASALYGIGKGISQSAQANKIDKNNIRQTYEIPKEYQENLNMAKQMAQIGLPQQQYNNQQNAILRNQSGGLQALGRSANIGSGVASLVRAGNDADNTLNAQDAAARQQNQRFAIGQNSVLGQQKLAQQQYNKFDKYTENFNRAQGLRGASNANINNSVNAASGMATGLASLSNGGTTSSAPNTQGDFGYTPYKAPMNSMAPMNSFGYSNMYTPDWGYKTPKL